MKKALFFLFFTLSISICQAQNSLYRPFKIVVSTGLGLATNKNKGGIIITLEPKYTFKDHISIGLRIEALSTQSPLLGANIPYYANYTNSNLLTGDYYVNKSKARFFAGLGMGSYTFSTSLVNPDKFKLTPVGNSYTIFGWVLRVGIEIRHLQVSLEYNIVPNHTTIGSNYLACKIGLMIGGGRQNL